MKLPQLISRFVDTQNTYDSNAYTACFTETAVVHDEGKAHTGRLQIRQWIEDANKRYQSVIKPLQYEDLKTNAVLNAEVSGKFPGSPIVLKFHIGLKDGLLIL